MNVSEFDLIAKIREQFPQPQGSVGIGDDCAIIGNDILFSTDLLVEGVHFLRDGIAPRDLGWKALAVNISDIAAMGGTPTASFLSMGIPTSVGDSFISEFLEGYRALSEEFGVALLGGDTTSAPEQLCINVGIMGKAPCGGAVRRSAALPGDLVCVSGTLGDAAAGLKCILEGNVGNPAAASLAHRHCHPEPRVELGRKLAAMPGIGAMMDISDGVASDIRHIMKESGVGASIDTGRLPLSDELLKVCAERGWDAIELAVGGGEDYELLFTCRPGSTIPPGCTVIGEITEGGDLTWPWSEHEYFGFTHF